MPPHHALYYETTDSEALVATLVSIASETAECEIIRLPALAIDDVRSLIERAYQRPAVKATRLFIIVVNSIALVTQNALLKLLEEPPATTRFALIMPPGSSLLPTVMSRLYCVPYEEAGAVTAVFEQFMQLSTTERIAYVTKVSKDKDDIAWQELAKGLTTFVRTSGDVSALRLRGYCSELAATLRLSGSSKKMIWEELAFLLPVVRGTTK
jgi:DNA polymerase III delta prime subunit